MSYHDRKWKAGWSGKGQLPYKEAMRNRPDHLVTIDCEGVYYERKRLKSKYYGVRWSQNRNVQGEWMEGRWEVSFESNREKHYGGRFREENEIEAAKAYDELVTSLGIARPLNFPSGDDDWASVVDELTPNDEIWLSHMEGREGKWLALAGNYPHTLVGVGDDCVEAMADAERNGSPDATLFKVPPPYPMCVTPFLFAARPTQT